MEILVVMSIIAIIATMSVPIFTHKIIAAQLSEAFSMLDEIKPEIKNYYRNYTDFPANNIALGLPEPEYLIGNYVEKIEIEQGAIHLYLGNKAHAQLAGKILSVRPQTVIGSPMSPISWGCGHAEPPKGMRLNGPDMTNINIGYLPYNCR